MEPHRNQPVHMHYSPYQFATAEQMAEPKKQVVAERKEWKKMTEEQNRKTRNLGSTMPVSVAHVVSSRPQAFISPNPPDVMRSSKSVFGC